MYTKLFFYQVSKCLFPRRTTNKSAGLDLSVPDQITLKPHEIVKLDLQTCVKIPEGHYGRLALRSSVALRGILLSGGVIDSDYTGTVKAILINVTDTSITLNKDERVIQLICEKCSFPEISQVMTLEEWNKLTEKSTRKDNGFGSSGV